jgi:Flp pilus assembly protein TadG
MMDTTIVGTTMKRVSSVFRRLAVETRATEIAEAAAVLPLMFMMLLGIFWFGQAFSIYGAITRAAQEGARAGAAPYCTTCTGGNSATANATAAVNSALTTSKLDPSKAKSPSPPTLVYCPPGTNQGNCPPNGICVKTPVQLSNTSGVCGISVSFQYPFQFWFPFTSLNKQQILLNASALVRLENQ